jgi:hypothetical protein
MDEILSSQEETSDFIKSIVRSIKKSDTLEQTLQTKIIKFVS